MSRLPRVWIRKTWAHKHPQKLIIPPQQIPVNLFVPAGAGQKAAGSATVVTTLEPNFMSADSESSSCLQSPAT